MNHTKRENRESKFFLTCTYGGEDPCLDQRCLGDIARLEGFCKEEIESGIMEAAMVWEERAPSTGTIHWHGIFILKREKRMRPAQFTQWFVQKLP